MRPSNPDLPSFASDFLLHCARDLPDEERKWLESKGAVWCFKTRRWWVFSPVSAVTSHQKKNASKANMASVLERFGIGHFETDPCEHVPLRGELKGHFIQRFHWKARGALFNGKTKTWMVTPHMSEADRQFLWKHWGGTPGNSKCKRTVTSKCKRTVNRKPVDLVMPGERIACPNGCGKSHAARFHAAMTSLTPSPDPNSSPPPSPRCFRGWFLKHVAVCDVNPGEEPGLPLDEARAIRLLRCRGCGNVDALTRHRGAVSPPPNKRKRVHQPWDDLTSDEDGTPMKRCMVANKSEKKCFIDLTNE